MIVEMHIRYYLVASNEDEARLLGAPVLSYIESISQSFTSNCYQYWKIPEQYGTLIIFKRSDTCRKSFQEILEHLGTAWEIHAAEVGSWAIWNHWKEGASFIAPTVLWAHLEEDEGIQVA